ncbi:MAG: hypothetical protein RL417_591 [Pseudomonadota bacterium]|jgi:putative heme iron utilization protein
MSEKAALYAAAARTLLTTARHGVLATTSVAETGFPFGSLTPYLIDEHGRITIYISLIAEHYKNLAHDPRGSLLVADPFGADDPQAYARATVLLRFTPAPPEERETIQRSYEARFPNSINYSIAHNFLFMRGEPHRIRWIGGFGEIGWIDRQTFCSAASDPLAESALDIIEHMNRDHGDALSELVRGFSTLNPMGKRIQMVGISALKITVRVDDTEGGRNIEIPFPGPIGPHEARGAVINLLKEARARSASR